MLVAVVGGGLSGLVSAFWAAKHGATPVVFEATDTLGGPMRTVRRDGFLAEEGPHTILAYPELLATVDALGLRGEIVEANDAAHRRFVVKDGAIRALPASPKALLSTNLYSRAAKLALLREPFLAARRDDVDESVTNFVMRRLHPELLTYGLELMVNGVWAGDPDKLSARHAFRRMYALEQTHGSLLRGAIAGRGKPRPKIVAFRDGNASFVRRIEQEFETRRESPVRTVDLNADHVLVDGERFDRIVMTAQRSVLSSIRFLGANVPDLEPVHRVDYPKVSIVSLGFRRQDVSHPLDGFGMIVPAVENFPILGALFPSSMFSGRAPDGHVLISAFIGGARNRCERSESELERVAVDSLGRLLGTSGEPTFCHVATWPHAIPQYNVGHSLVLQSLQTFERANPTLSLVGGLQDGISVPDLVAAASKVGREVATDKNVLT